MYTTYRSSDSEDDEGSFEMESSIQLRPKPATNDARKASVRRSQGLRNTTGGGYVFYDSDGASDSDETSNSPNTQEEKHSDTPPEEESEEAATGSYMTADDLESLPDESLYITAAQCYGENSSLEDESSPAVSEAGDLSGENSELPPDAEENAYMAYLPFSEDEQGEYISAKPSKKRHSMPPQEVTKEAQETKERTYSHENIPPNSGPKQPQSSSRRRSVDRNPLSASIDSPLKRSFNSSSNSSSSEGVIGNSSCYWNTEFQKALGMPEGREQWTKLAKLARDFVYCSKTYGKIIISEYYLPNEEKTIKSTEAGGLAGGSKYVCSNIFFKFALDTDLMAERRQKSGKTEEEIPPLWMYGGDQCDDFSAMKASKNDMRGLISYYNAKVPDLYFPLMSLINYRGFSLIAMSILPISKSSIRYGSADGGLTIHRRNAQINEKMKVAAEQLNLKGHRTGKERIFIYGPGDIEVHEGADNKFYVVDFGRTFPPEAPAESGSRKVFYCLLRPEFVRTYPKPLSSDAYSMWGRCNSKTHNEEVKEATEHLYNFVIPKFAAELGAKEKEDSSMNVSEIRLTEALHSSGINCRHLGRVRSELPNDCEKTSRMLLTEMVARLMSGLLRQLLRLEMKRTRVASQEPYKKVVIDFLNALLKPTKTPSRTRGHTDSSPYHLSSTQWGLLSTNLEQIPDVHSLVPTPHAAISMHKVESCDYLVNPYFWYRDVKSWLEDKFMKALFPHETKPSFNIRDALDTRMLAVRLCQQSGIKLSKHAMDEFFRHPDDFEVLNFDLRKVSARVKHLNIIDEAEGNLLFLEAQSHSHREGLWDAISRKFARAVCSNTNNPATFVRWGQILLKQCNHFRSKQDASEVSQKLLANASEKFQSALKLNPRMHEAHFEQGIQFAMTSTLAILYKPEDTIALGLHQFKQAMDHFHIAFQNESSYFQKLLLRADDLLAQAEAFMDHNSVRCEFLLTAFIILHCGVSVAPITPDPDIFFLAGFILKEYLAAGGHAGIGKSLYGLAGVYFESAFLKVPAISDGHLIYYHQKSIHQIKRLGTRPNISSPSRWDDSIVIYQLGESSSTEQRKCSLMVSDEVRDVRQDFPLYFFPVLYEDNIPDYHYARSLNRIMHLVGGVEWEGNKLGQTDSSSDDILRMSSKASTFVLQHSSFHAFCLTHISIALAKFDEKVNINSRNVPPPSQICFYGSNCQDVSLLTREKLNVALGVAQSESHSMSQLREKLQWTHIHTEVIPIARATEDVVISIPVEQARASRYLIVHFGSAATTKDFALRRMCLRGYPYYVTQLPRLINSRGSELKGTRILRPGNPLSRSFHNTKEPAKDVSKIPSRLGWATRRDPQLSFNKETVTIVNTEHDIISVQSLTALSLEAPPMHSKKIPLGRYRASVSLRNSSGLSSNAKTAPVLNSSGTHGGILRTIWIDMRHNSYETGVLCKLAEMKSSQLEIIKLNNVLEAVHWMHEHERSSDGSDSDRSLGRDSFYETLSGMIKKRSIRIVVTRECNYVEDQIPIEEELESLEQWKNVPLFIFDQKTNPTETNTYRAALDTPVFISDCAKTCVDFASFVLPLSDLDLSPLAGLSSSRAHSDAVIRRQRNLSMTISPLQSSERVLSKQFFYFEVRIVTMNASDFVTVGLSTRQFSLVGIQLGCHPGTLGLRNDGLLWCGFSDQPCRFVTGKQFEFHQGDVVGCGFDARTRQVFWTKNGNYLGYAERGHSRILDDQVPLFPTVCANGPCVVEGIFGNKTSFAFTVADHLENYTDTSRMVPVASIHPFSKELLSNALDRHNMELLVLSVIANFSRTLNMLLRYHIDHWQTRQVNRPVPLVSLLDSCPLAESLQIPHNSYSSIDLTRVPSTATDYHLLSLWRMMAPNRPITLSMGRWELSGMVFGRLSFPKTVACLDVSNCNLQLQAALCIAENLTSLYSISLWRTIEEKGISTICSMPSLKRIDFSDCINLTDQVLTSAFKARLNLTRNSFESLSFANCGNLSDTSILQLISKSSTLLKGLKALNLNFCNKISTNAISKLLHCCRELQHIHLASNPPPQKGMTDQIVQFIANTYNQRLQSLVLIRSTNLTDDSINLLASQCPNLTHIDLAHCSEITDEALFRLADSGSSLVKLDLFNTRITDRTALHFVSKHKNLRYISFSRCNNLTHDGLKACVRLMKAVEFLSLRENALRGEVLDTLYLARLSSLVLVDISSCSYVTPDAVKLLNTRLPNVLVNTLHEKSKKYSVLENQPL